jgi:Smg protein
MFDILVYLYETYYRPDTCPESIALAKKLSSAGFETDEISEALDWLTVLAETTRELILQGKNIPQDQAVLIGFRIYTEQEAAILGVESIGFIHYLESTEVLNFQQREIVIELALATNESPVPLDKLKIIVLMMLWSQCKDMDSTTVDELLLTEESTQSRRLH